MMMSNFDASVFVSGEMEKQLLNMNMDFGMRLISECAKLYGFDADEAVRALNIVSLKMVKKPVAKKSPKKQAKASFPIPFNGKAIEGCCGGLRFNRGLYTQCQGKAASESGFCNGCQAQADKNGNGKPDCGTIGDRLVAGLYEFQDPKGKSPIAFTALLKKLKLSEEAVKEEAGKLNIEIDDEHFEYIAIEKKKGRKSTKTDVPKKEKKEKGRPKKSKKILELEGESSDLFASLVAQANASSESEPTSESEQDDSDELIIESKTNKNESQKAKKEEERLAKLAEKEAKRLAAEAEKEAKRKAAEEKKEEERLAKEAAKLAEKEAKRLAAEAEKEAKRKAAEEKKEEERKAKEAAKLTEKKEKVSSPKKETAKEKKEEKKEEKKDDGEPDVVKRFEFDGKKYLKSKKTGIVYNLDQDVIGKWNEETQKIEFYENDSDSEEEEEGYDSE
jgi:hypothetical protein